MTSKAGLIREYLYEKPSASFDDVAEALKINKKEVQINVGRDVKRGRAILNGSDIDYSKFFEEKQERKEQSEYISNIRRSMIDRLVEVNETITDPDTLRLNMKMINQMLDKI